MGPQKNEIHSSGLYNSIFNFFRVKFVTKRMEPSLKLLGMKFLLMETTFSNRLFFKTFPVDATQN